MKRKIAIFIYLVGALALMAVFTLGCTTEGKLKRAISKHGQKESAAYLFQNYPEYFKRSSDSVFITVHDTMYVYVPESVLDTFFLTPDSSLIIENSRLKVSLHKLANGWHLMGQSKEVRDTIYIEIPIVAACPEVIQPTSDVLNYKKPDHFRMWLFLISFSAAFFLIFIMIKAKSKNDN